MKLTAKENKWSCNQSHILLCPYAYAILSAFNGKWLYLCDKVSHHRKCYCSWNICIGET